MEIKRSDWNKYIKMLSDLDGRAADLAEKYIEKHGFGNMKALVDYVYALVEEYGGAASALAAEMYDATSLVEKAMVPPAEPAPTPEYGEVAKTMYGIHKTSENPNEYSGAVGRMVKRQGADTTLQNALRDGAEFAWVPNGDTCPFCITLASRGWQKMSKDALAGGHAEHIHSHCDCTYAVRQDGRSTIEGYDPEVYRRQYYGAEGDTPQARINYMRRQQYAADSEKYRAQKRAVYAQHKKTIDIIDSQDYNNTPIGVKDDERILLDRLTFTYMGVTAFIPLHTIVQECNVIAGKGAKKPIRIAKQLSEKYIDIESNPFEWKKCVGKIRSAKFLFDIHWYECSDKIVREPKIKFMKELK